MTLNIPLDIVPLPHDLPPLTQPMPADQMPQMPLVQGHNELNARSLNLPQGQPAHHAPMPLPP